jgi:FixJ family two-component response regulator
MGRVRIAQVSADAMLAKSRAELLRSAGYQVQTFTSFNDLLHDSNQEFDLLIIGHSLEYRSKGEIENLFKQTNPRFRILQLVATNHEGHEADILFDVYKGPDKLLEFIKQMVETRSFKQRDV